jgi:hypothetical protein
MADTNFMVSVVANLTLKAWRRPTKFIDLSSFIHQRLAACLPAGSRPLLGASALQLLSQQVI